MLRRLDARFSLRHLLAVIYPWALAAILIIFVWQTVAARRAAPPASTRADMKNTLTCSTMLHDVLLGDRSLFTRPDGLAAVWQVADPLLRNRPEPLPYPPGSWGPAPAAELAAPDGWLLGQ